LIAFFQRIKITFYYKFSEVHRQRDTNPEPHPEKRHRDDIHHLNITNLLSTIDYPMINKRIASITLIKTYQYQTILAKSPGTHCILIISTEHLPPSSPKQWWFLEELHAVTETQFVHNTAKSLRNRQTLF